MTRPSAINQLETLKQFKLKKKNIYDFHWLSIDSCFFLFPPSLLPFLSSTNHRGTESFGKAEYLASLRHGDGVSFDWASWGNIFMIPGFYSWLVGLSWSQNKKVNHILEFQKHRTESKELKPPHLCWRCDKGYTMIYVYCIVFSSVVECIRTLPPNATHMRGTIPFPGYL